jgi:triosephosphate isomerase (TIM)
MAALLLAGNWKMFKTRPEAKQFVQALNALLPQLTGQNLPDMLLCGPYTTLETLLTACEGSPVMVGAQNVADHTEGAYTGEVAAPMLQELGLKWVLAGHSERRQYDNDTSARVAEKTRLALASGLTPIVCVGESLAQREAGQTDAVITEQVNAVLAIPNLPLSSVVWAYEPVWAIGTGKVCETPEANRVCALIHHLAPGGRVLYGGSVKPDNALELLSQSAIDGALVGGASLQADSYFALVQAAQQALQQKAQVLAGKA